MRCFIKTKKAFKNFISIFVFSASILLISNCKKNSGGDNPPSPPPGCDLAITPLNPIIKGTQTQQFTASGKDANNLSWDSSAKNCATIDTNGLATGLNATSTCPTTISVKNTTLVSCPAVTTTLTVEPAGTPSACTTTSPSTLPPSKTAADGTYMLGVTLYNDTGDNCFYKDQEIYIQIIGHPYTPFASNAWIANSLPFYIMKSITNGSDGYPIVEMALAPDDSSPLYPLVVPYFTLSQLKAGGFYLKIPKYEYPDKNGKDTDTTYGMSATRIHISLGAPLKSLTLTKSTYYNQPIETTPWDIFEFGYDAKHQQQFGFNTTQVEAFSIPLWFTFNDEAKNPSGSNPNTLPLGIKLRDSDITINPAQLKTRDDIIALYSKTVPDDDKLFGLNRLKKTYDSDQKIGRILSPAVLPTPSDSNYFDNSFKFFQEKFIKNDQSPWTFWMCDNDPGPSSTIQYPACAKNSAKCDNTNPTPSGDPQNPRHQCDAITGNKCDNPGAPPSGYRFIGRCFVGYVDNKTFNYFTFQSDIFETKPSSGEDPCIGTVAFNGDIRPILNPPNALCKIDLNIPNETKCTLENNCYANNKDHPTELFNTQFMGAIMRSVATNIDGTIQPKNSADGTQINFVRWTYHGAEANEKYYQTEPFHVYSHIMHLIGSGHYAYGVGFDDTAGQSTTYTPKAGVKNLIIGIGW